MTQLDENNKIKTGSVPVEGLQDEWALKATTLDFKDSVLRALFRQEFIPFWHTIKSILNWSFEPWNLVSDVEKWRDEYKRIH